MLWKRSLLLSGAALGLFSAFFPAGAADDEAHDVQGEALSEEQLHALHARFDSNGDGKASLQEVLAFAETITKAIAKKDVASILDEIDTSKDGKLSLEEHLNDLHNQVDVGDEEEMKALEQRKVVETRKFAAADANGDRFLDADELPYLFYPETHPGVLKLAVEDTMATKDLDHDGKLSPHEFWEADEEDRVEGKLSDEEQNDFMKLDADKNGFLDAEELAVWESGRYHTESSMLMLLQIADKDHDMHLSAAELAQAREEITASDAQYHLMEWAEHIEL